MLWLCLLLAVAPVSTQYLNITETPENIIRNPCTDRNHLVLAPGVLTAGGTNRACISRFYPNGPVTLKLTLVAEDRQTITASRELPAGDGGCLDFNVPLLPNTKADFTVNVNYHEAQCSWERRMSLRISAGHVVVIHTERARYRPGETVRLRVLALKPDLTPSHGLIEEAWLEGPPGAWEGSRVTQWLRLRTRLGLAQLQHQLDDLAPPGKWTARARLADGSQGTAVFWVGNYELPPFQLSVRHAPRVLRSSERLVWTVCVRYPWSEAVEGMLVIRLRGAGGVSGSSGGIRTAVQLRAPKACHRHAAASRRIGLNGTYPPDVVVADFSFQEEGTRIWQNTTVVSQVVDKPISLEFLTKHKAVISPGLPYKLKVKATRWDDKPATNEHVRVCRYPSHQPVDLPLATSRETTRDTICAEGVVDASGVARLLFAAGDDAAPFYRFEAQLSNDSSTSAAVLWLRCGRGTRAGLGPLRPEPGTARTLLPLYLNLPNITTALTVHFVVITRGGIIYRWGATTQCPISSPSDQIRTAARNSRCNVPYYDGKVQRDVIMAQRNNNALKTDSNAAQNFAKYDTNSIIPPPSISNGPQNSIKPAKYDRNSINANSDLLSKYDRYSRLIAKIDSNAAQNGYARHGTNALPHDGMTSPSDTAKETNTTQVDSDALLNRHLLRVMLPIKVSHQMCPDSHLIAYFYYNGEFISASKHFEMEECFANKVEATWVSRQVMPGSTASLQVSTAGPALCALNVLDTAAKWAQPPVAFRDTLMSGLRRLVDSHRNLTEYDAAGDCFFNVDTPEIPTSNIELTSSWLAAAGVRMLGGDLPAIRHCEPQAPAALIADDGSAPRTDFSEAWLWRLLAIGMNGTGIVSARAPDSITRFEAGATCVSRNGVAISPPAVLQVFREFFIHADSPKRLRQGDTTIIKYRIFNYLYEPLSVQIQILADPHVEGPKSPTESACIAARSSIARRAEITARIAAPARVSIRAKAVGGLHCVNVTSRRTGVSDEVIIKIQVEPEGVPVHEQKSILLCGNKSAESSTSEVLWQWPPVKSVPGTETLTVWAAGDVTGPLLADADSLVLIPRGCGEQNMAQLATNLLALHQLDPGSVAALTAQEHVARGFTRQLQYVHPSGGFSAFGAADSSSSTWLTAFAVKHLRKAHKLLWPNLQAPPAIIRAERWLLTQQMENGCFRNEGQVFHRELRGGLNEEGEIASVALTAYVITSLLDSTSPLPFRIVRNTLSCLRALPPLKSQTPSRVYAHALLAYAYVRLEKYEEDLRKTNEASLLRRNMFGAGLERDEGVRRVQELLKMASRNGDFVWWEASSLSTSIEATSYALLALREGPPSLREGEGGDAAAGARRWLAAHRGVSGGFVSTQDTLVGLEALSSWSSMRSAPTELTVTATCSGLDSSTSLQPADTIPHVMKMRPGDKLNVAVRGTGCALVQATRSYNTLSPDSLQQKQLSVQVSVHTDGPFDCDNNATTCYCAAVVEACVMWSGAFPEMALLEVSLPSGFAADAALLYSQLQKPYTLIRRIELSASNNRATFYLATRDGSDTTRGGHSCGTLHVVGPQANTRPAYVRLVDYYRPMINDTQVYTIPEDCPPRITHNTNEYHASDNLFNKARSLDSDDIIITHDFFFEDIPEGIPMEDPLYDNLTRREKEADIERDGGNTEEDKDRDGDRRDKDDPYSDRIGYIREEVHTNSHRDINGEVNMDTDNNDSVNNKVVAEVFDVPSTDTIKSETNGANAKRDDKIRNQDVKITEQRPVFNDSVNNILNIVREIENNFNAVAKSGHIYTNHKLNNSKIQLHNNVMQNMDRFTLNKHKVSDQNTEEFDETINTKNNSKPETIKAHNNLSKEQLTHKENDIKSTQGHTPYPKIDTEFSAKLTESTTELIHGVDNPNLSDFHIIDTEKDLEVPSGLEGPVPAIVLPPQGFVPPPDAGGRRLHSVQTPHGPYYYRRADDNVFDRRYFMPVY